MNAQHVFNYTVFLCYQNGYKFIPQMNRFHFYFNISFQIPIVRVPFTNEPLSFLYSVFLCYQNGYKFIPQMNLLHFFT